MDIVTRFAIRPEGDGSVVTASFHFQPKGVMRLLMPLLAGSVCKDIPRQVAAFARTLEPTS